VSSVERPALQCFVGAVAHDGGRGVFAAAEEDFLGLRGLEFHRSELGAFVRAVTKWLLGGLAAGAPEIGFASLDLDGERAFWAMFGVGMWAGSNVGEWTILKNVRQVLLLLQCTPDSNLGLLFV